MLEGPHSHGLARAALILGLVAAVALPGVILLDLFVTKSGEILLGCLALAPVVGLAALVVGILARRRMSTGTNQGRGMAFAGIMLGMIAAAAGIAGWLFILAIRGSYG